MLHKLTVSVAMLALVGAMFVAPSAGMAQDDELEISAVNVSILEVTVGGDFNFGAVAPDGRGTNPYEVGPVPFGSDGGFAYSSGNQAGPYIVANLDWTLSLTASSGFTAVGTGGTDMNLSNVAVLVNPTPGTTPGSGSPALIGNWGPNATLSGPQQIDSGPNTGVGGWAAQYYQYWLRSLWANNPGDLTVEFVFTLAPDI
jgi:hypothetical protein